MGFTFFYCSHQLELPAKMKINKNELISFFMSEQARKGFRAISVSQNFWGIWGEFFKNFLGILWELFEDV